MWKISHGVQQGKRLPGKRTLKQRGENYAFQKMSL